MNTSSYFNAKDCWIREIYHHVPPPKAIVVLVGTKTDLRNDIETLDDVAREGRCTLKSYDGWTLAREIGAEAYVECSSLTREGLSEVFEVVFKLAGIHIQRRKEDPKVAKKIARKRGLIPKKRREKYFNTLDALVAAQHLKSFPPEFPRAQYALQHIEVFTSSMGKDFGWLNHPTPLSCRYADVNFIVRQSCNEFVEPGKDSPAPGSFRQFPAHKMVLAAASPLFARIFHLENPALNVSSLDFIGLEIINNGDIPAFSSVREDSFQTEHFRFPVQINTEKWGRLELEAYLSGLFPTTKQGMVLTLASHITDDLWQYDGVSLLWPNLLEIDQCKMQGRSKNDQAPKRTGTTEDTCRVSRGVGNEGTGRHLQKH